MTLPVFFFYVFAFIAVASALMVISSRNPVHSVLFLILTFLNAAGIFMLGGAEFLALILVVVYVGAVMVLFLFVVMMLDVDFAELKRGALQYMPIGVVIGIIVLIELLMVAGSQFLSPELAAGSVLPFGAGVSNTQALGEVLYTRYVFLFLGAGMVLLVAMIGAIVLTLHHRPNVRRQDISAQVARNPKTAIEVVKVKPGQGL